MWDWITVAADRIKAQTRADGTRPREPLRHSPVEHRWTRLWTAVVIALSRDVAAFNREFPGEPGQHLTLDHQIAGLSISRDGSPFRQLRICATAEGIQVQLFATDLGTMQRVSRDIPPFVFIETSLGLGVEQNGHPLTPDAMSEHMLRQLL